MVFRLACSWESMVMTKTSSDIHRDIGTTCDCCDRTDEPVDVTCNSKPSLVVMNADAYDEVLAQQSDFMEELERYKVLMHSETDRLKDDTYTWEDVERERGLRTRA